MTISLPLFTQIERNTAWGSSISIVDDEGTERRLVSDLLSQGESMATTLQASGIEPGTRVGAVARTSFDFIVALLAAWRAGCTFVPLPPPLGSSGGDSWGVSLASRVRQAGLHAVLGGPNERLPDLPTRVLRIHSRPGSTEPSTTDPGCALIQFSSGTTDRARGVLLSAHALKCQISALHQRFRLEGSSGDRMVSWLPLNHDLGFVSYLLRPLMEGIDVALMPPRYFLKDPSHWLRLISGHEGVYSAAPNFAFALAAKALRRARNGEFDLSGWRHASIGGEPVDVQVLTAFAAIAERFGLGPHVLSPGYGLAEAVCVVTVGSSELPYRVDTVDRGALSEGVAQMAQRGQAVGTSQLVSVGVPLPGTEVRIDVGSGPEELERVVGEIRVKAPFLMTGYLDDLAATTQALQGGWLRTGDLGYIADGELFVTGRSKDVIVIRGRNLYAEDVERLIHGISGVRPGAVVALSVSDGPPESLLIAAESALTDPRERIDCQKAIERRVWTETGVAPRSVLLLPPGSLPKTSSGKLQRKRAAAMISGGKCGG